MMNNESIDNFLFDEENRYTQADDLWSGYLAESLDEIDERPWVQADSLSLRRDLNRQVADLLGRVLTEEEEELVRLYFGIGRRRHSMDELAALFDGETRVLARLQAAMDKLRYSDEILSIYKYLHK